MNGSKLTNRAKSSCSLLSPSRKETAAPRAREAQYNKWADESAEEWGQPDPGWEQVRLVSLKAHLVRTSSLLETRVWMEGNKRV